MIIIFDGDESTEHARQVRLWWHQNGMMGVSTDGPILVDTDRRTISYRRLAGEPQPGDEDFPELPRDAWNRPRTVEQTAPLRVDPPLWALASPQDRQVA
jgi:hypothetical protein